MVKWRNYRGVLERASDMKLLLKDYDTNSIDAIITTSSDEHNDIFVQDRIASIIDAFPQEYDTGDIERMCDSYGWEIEWIENCNTVEW